MQCINCLFRARRNASAMTSAGRLITIDSPASVEHYAYDPAGNLTAV
ncbi:hypothetical protein E4656_20025, partial [Natronospirillum operosum]